MDTHAFRRVLPTVTLLLCVCCGLSVETALAQTDVTPAPILINGAESPELISDELAYQHFIKSISNAEMSATQVVYPRDAILASMGLSRTDRAALIVALGDVWQQLDTIDKGRQRPPSNATNVGPHLADLQRQENAVLDNARVRLRSSLSEEGRDRLDTYIRDDVKRHIIVYGY